MTNVLGHVQRKFNNRAFSVFQLIVQLFCDFVKNITQLLCFLLNFLSSYGGKFSTTICRININDQIKKLHASSV